MPALSSDSRATAGVLLLTILAVEYGGLAVLRIVRGRQPATGFQKAFARAGHAHAGVFVVFALLAQVLAGAAHLHGVASVLARDGIWAAAILFPAGFFGSSAGRGATRPGKLIVLVYLGAAALTAGVLALGIGPAGSQQGPGQKACPPHGAARPMTVAGTTGDRNIDERKAATALSTPRTRCGIT